MKAELCTRASTASTTSGSRRLGIHALKRWIGRWSNHDDDDNDDELSDQENRALCHDCWFEKWEDSLDYWMLGGVTDSLFFSTLVCVKPSHCFNRISWGNGKRKRVRCSDSAHKISSRRLVTVSRFPSGCTQIFLNTTFLLCLLASPVHTINTFWVKVK